MVETFPDDKMQQQALPLQPEGGTSSGQTLLVVGAGPKAIALAAKREVLAKLGLPVPELVIVDFQGVAAHWSGQFGFTDGTIRIGLIVGEHVPLTGSGRPISNGLPAEWECV